MFFTKKSEMTAFAKAFTRYNAGNWFLRTTLPCNHRVRERRKAIILITGETIVRRLVICSTCKEFRDNASFDRGVVATLKNVDNEQ